MLSRLVYRSISKSKGRGEECYLGTLRCFSSIPQTMRCVDITEYGAPEVDAPSDF